MTEAPREVRADALLDAVEGERQRRLKIFLGAAPGVGKTWAMLSAARELKKQGIDVVVGLVETHGRPETAALLEGLEVTPRSRADPRCCWSTNWRTPTCRAAATNVAGRTSPSCWTPASRCTPR
jgi:hypothetical protein